MREIKFRAWVKKHNNMYIVRTIRFDSRNATVNNVSLEGYPVSVGRDDIEIMEYTGLKDKNGVEIYEGDIIQFQTFDASGIVAYDSPSFVASGMNLKGYEVEVIGNIYANPGLLK